MIYPKHISDVLGFDQVLIMVRNNCRHSGALRLMEKVQFSSKPKQISLWLTQVGQYKSLLEGGSHPNLSDVDLYPHIHGLSDKSNILSREDILEIRTVCVATADVLDFFYQKKESHPALFEIIETLENPEDLVAQINQMFDEFGQWKRNASKKLERILDEIDVSEKSAYSIIRRIYNEAAEKNWVSDTDITIKDGRLVIPVIPEHKKKVPGVMHDESAGGTILYIEPLAVLEATNKLRQLELERDRELKHLLKTLTASVRARLTPLKLINQRMAVLDFIRAKAKVAMQMEANVPQLSSDLTAEIYDLYHPLLFLSNVAKKKETVPLSYALNEEQRMILISGPNAGGKSVTIKSVALNQYMLQSGFLPCAKPDSVFPIYKNIFTDIGDNQSIEQDLSSYSSHLTAMKYFIEYADRNSLVIIDEIGSGTDPNFGGAMAEATLIELNKKLVRAFVTTHYGQVKSLAKGQEGMVNAQMQYDTKALRPLYKFKIGKPGSSFALEIAQKIGFSKKLLALARKRSNLSQHKTDELLATVEIEREELADKLKDVQAKEAHMNQLIADYERLKKELTKAKKDILTDAKDTAAALIEQANKEIERTIKEIKESQASKAKTRQVRAHLQQTKEKLSPSRAKKQHVEVMKPVQVGSTVRIPNSSSTGEVLEIRKNKAVVLAGIMKSTFLMSELVVVKGAKENRKSKVNVGFIKRSESFSMEKDVRGMRAQEAIKEIDHWIDDAVVIGAGSLRLIHGKGDGILKQLVRDYYHNNPYIKRISYEDVRMGGEGVSIIELA